MNVKWNFPHGKKLTPMGVNDPAINSFKSNIIDSLARETIQNSLDARDSEKKEPVKVTFSFSDIETKTLPGFNELKEIALENAIKFWKKKGNDDTVKFLERFKSVIEADKVKILKISDYNTCGLDDTSYDALVLGNGYSEKANENAAGSKGIGKAAPFAASDLRLVFYNTVPKDGIVRHAGVLNFVSFNPPETEPDIITQSRALYQDETTEYVPGQINFGFEEREKTEYGTDLFVVGLRNSDEDWENKIIFSTVNNFLVSILENKLVVVVNDRIINKETIQEVLIDLKNVNWNSDEKRLLESTENYYEAYTSPDSITFDLDESFKAKYSFIEDVTDGKLILLKKDRANRAILQTRISGMKIYDRRSISRSINFTGIFRATGKELDKFLRALENTNHDNWSPDQLSDNRKEAKAFLDDLYRWFKDKVIDSFVSDSADSIDAIGLSSFLPARSRQQGGNSESKERGIKNKIDKVEIRRQSQIINLTNSAEEQEKSLEELINEVDGSGNESSGNIGNGRGNGSGDGFGTNPGAGHGHLPSVGEDGPKTGEKNMFKKVNELFASKCILLDKKSGKYKFILKPKKSMRLVELEFKYVGEDGSVTKAKIKGSNSGTNNITYNTSRIRMENVKKDSLAIVEVEFDTVLLVKWEVNVYEIKG
ncbi:hypothetical protein O3793_05475 [Granulicatella sp. 20925_1_28]|jgi:hypothetical protein|uniref:hypothetical protein n=1 Tax=Granulicatella sp. 20925_1_28 TaxID=3003686 RepID=UPI00352FEB91